MTVAADHPLRTSTGIRALRVGVVLPSLKLGGAERLIVETMRHARDASLPLEWVTFALSRRDDQLSAELRSLGSRVEWLDLDGRADPRAILRLRAAIRAARVDVVHSHLPRTGVLTRLALVGTGIPHVYTEHNVPDAYRTPTRQLSAWTLGWNDAIVSVSDRVREEMHAASPRLTQSVRTSIVIGNGVDARAVRRAAADGPAVRASLQLPPGAKLLGFLAHFRPEKGHTILLDALARLARNDVHLVLAGRDDGTESQVREAVGARGLGDHVTFLGFRADAAAVLAAIDMLVIPSLQEGLPVALLEGMALERPVVATRAGGIPQAITDGHDGLLVPTGDAEALADAIGALLDAPERAASLGRAALHTVEERFGLARMVREYAALYESLARRGVS